MKRFRNCLLALLWPAGMTYAQAQPAKLHPLTIGDTVPNLVLKNTINHFDSTIQLSQYKGKLIILDFWSSWCGACIKLFPYMDSLQKAFKDDIQILLVNSRSKASGDDEKKIRKIMDAVVKRTGQPIRLPVVFDNPLLDDYFPHQYLPHEVWLDSNSVVLAITSAQELTHSNIKAYLEGERLSLHHKEDQKNFDENKPLFLAGNGGDGETFIARSIIAPYTEGLKNNLGQVNTATTSRLYAFNLPFSALLRMAYPEAMDVPANRLVLNGRKAKELLGTLDTASRYSQLFCYDLIVPLTTEANLYKYLRVDLERTFGVQVKMKKRKMECWSLTATRQIAKAYTKGAEPKWDFDAYSKHKFIQNQPISTIVKVLNSFFPIPLVNETGLTKNIDLSLPQQLNDTRALIKSLKEAGFDVKKTIRELPVTIITTLY